MNACLGDRVSLDGLGALDLDTNFRNVYMNSFPRRSTATSKNIPYFDRAQNRLLITVFLD